MKPTQALLAIIFVLFATTISVALCENDTAKTSDQVVPKELAQRKKLSRRQNTYDWSSSSANNEENWPESESENNNNNNNYYQDRNEQQNTQQHESSSKNNQQQSVVDRNHYASAQALYARQQVLLNVNFFEDADQVDPRNPSAEWEWFGTGTGTGYLADRASFVKRPAGAHKSGGHLDMISVPFTAYLNISDPGASLVYFESAIQPKNTTFTPSASQRISARLLYGCDTVNADKFPFPARLVRNPWNDPRLVSCVFQLTGNNDTGFAILATNEGVWAVYYRLNFTGSSQLGTQTFTSYRPIGSRNSWKDPIDAAIEYDARLNQGSYFLNGVRVWAVSPVGAPPPNDGITKITANLDGTTARAVTLTSLQVSLGTFTGLDDPDPNNPRAIEAIARIQDDRAGYPPAAFLTFYDPVGYKGNRTWGQGAIASLYKLKVILSDLIVTPLAQTGAYDR